MTTLVNNKKSWNVKAYKREDTNGGERKKTRVSYDVDEIIVEVNLSQDFSLACLIAYLALTVAFLNSVITRRRSFQISVTSWLY